jgi:hypothetical protein
MRASFESVCRRKENPLWGAPRIHRELLKLGFEVAESTVSKYMIRRRGPPSQELADISGNHADAIAAIDLCVVPTLTFERLSSMSEKFISTQPVALLSAPQVPECAQELV